MHNPSHSSGHDGPQYNPSSVVDSYWHTTPSLSPDLSTSTTQAFIGPNANFPSNPHVGNPSAQLSYSSYPPSMLPSGFSNPDQRLAPPSDNVGNNKVAIPRLAAPTTYRGRRRSARACEPCRQRKIKCDGVRPTCGQCSYHNSQCLYEDVKRVRDQKMLELLSKRTERYESLLRDLEGDVDTPTARRIRKALKVKDNKTARNNDNPDDSDSDSSVGSLEAVDLVEEDLNRNETTRAAGFFGKNSEVAWMQRLEDGIEQKTSWPGSRLQSTSGSSAVASQSQSPHALAAVLPSEERLDRDLPIAMMNYHLDDLDIPVVGDDSDPVTVPPRETADKYFDAYMTFVHPTFSVLRKSTFTAQYLQFFSRPTQPPPRWLGILNMIFAIGCRYCKLIDPGAGSAWEDGLVYLTRARQLSLRENVLFEHTDLQQIQLEFLVAVYLLCLGQVNRASKFSGLALRSALSLGINLHITDGRTHDASKEARCRLWWSIYSLEHLLTSMHGRASCVGEGLCSVSPPLPFEEDFFEQPEISRLLQDRAFREAQLRPTLFETPSQLQCGPTWMADCKPCPALFFYHLTDLALISHAVLNKIYSIEGLRECSSVTEYRLQKYRLCMDRWLAKVPPPYRFTVPEAGPWHLNHAQLDDENAPFARERVCLAMNYYSARIILCRPCLSQTHSPQPLNSPPAQDANHRTKLRTDMATDCLQAACSLISILPDNPDIAWLVRVTPWWSVLHFIMQATTALLLALSFVCFPKQTNLPSSSTSNSGSKSNIRSASVSGSDPSISNTPALLDTDIETVIAQAKKALRSIHTMAHVDPAARRAFVLCDGVVRKLAPALNIDLKDWPNVESLVGRHGGGGGGEKGERKDHGGGVANDRRESDSRLEGLNDLVDFDGGGG
ncbi:uncharacterized protein N7496_000213 [Penicillium cataractarum]|uniref:Zn(2)-C6 fungal-type domain-containing protein n=1 Tax=Penicillium cataractarum TaxID=2100454 RepID=A0A9W9VTW2_9EURO|nr:uncharacterized protein N7496_000213 [Penicillium cataractarum]KAJ5389145.1 hypothetical protein N7496_000213 [Penicillium cataractarum]